MNNQELLAEIVHFVSLVLESLKDPPYECYVIFQTEINVKHLSNES